MSDHSASPALTDLLGALVAGGFVVLDVLRLDDVPEAGARSYAELRVPSARVEYAAGPGLGAHSVSVYDTDPPLADRSTLHGVITAFSPPRSDTEPPPPPLTPLDLGPSLRAALADLDALRGGRGTAPPGEYLLGVGTIVTSNDLYRRAVEVVEKSGFPDLRGEDRRAARRRLRADLVSVGASARTRASVVSVIERADGEPDLTLGVALFEDLVSGLPLEWAVRRAEGRVGPT